MKDQATLITARLAEIKMSQAELARQTGLSQTYINHVAKGNRTLTKPETIRKVADILDIDPDELWFANGKLPPDTIKEIIRARRSAIDGTDQ